MWAIEVRDHREEAVMIRRIERPWGEEILFAHTEAYAGKLLNINKANRAV